MTVYAVDKLMAETRRLAAEYHRQTGQALPVSNELARYDISRLFGFQEPPEPIKGVDLVGSKEPWLNKMIQVKARVSFDDKKINRQRIGQVQADGEWDWIMLVLMDENYNPNNVYACSRKKMLDAIPKEKSKKSSKGAMSVARFKAIGKLLWTELDGFEKSEDLESEKQS